MVVERYSYGLYGDPDTQAFVDTARTNLLVSQDAIDKHAEVFSWSIDYIGTDGLRGDLRADVDGDGMISSWDQLRFAQQQTAWTLINFEQIAANSDEPINGWSTLGQLSRPHPVGMKPTGEPLDAGTVSQPGLRDLHKLRGVVQLDNRLGYAGYVWDPFLQMYHVRHRVLNPRLGIWMQPDPIGYAGGWNLHEYCGGDPLGFVDPMGLWRWDGDWIESGLRAAAGAVGLGGPVNTAAASGARQGASDGLTLVADSTAQLLTVGGRIKWLEGTDELHAEAVKLRAENGTSYSIATGAGYVANVAAAAAGVVMLMEAAVSQVGGGTMHVTIGTVKRQTLPHVIYGVGNNTVHAMGSTFFRMRVVAFETYLPFVPRITISGIPVWNAKAVVETGGSAWSCVSAAINAGLRGWGL